MDLFRRIIIQQEPVSLGRNDGKITVTEVRI